MSPSTSSIYTRTSRVRGARSVLGCLTCRRRRVKCTVQKSPCDNCQHLNLTCTPSFHANFKNWTPFVASNSHTGTPKGVRESELAVTTDLEVVESGGDEVALDIGFATEELPQDVILWLSNGLNNGSFDLGTTPTSRSFESRQMAREMPNLDTDGWNQLSPSATSYNRESYPFNGSTYNNRISAAMGTTQLTVRQHAPSTSVPTDSSISNHYDLEGLDLFASSTNLFNLDSPWEIPQIPPQMSQVYGNSHGDMPFLDQYESNMPQLLTAKTSPWNPYSYMLNSTRDCPESPLRYGILSWTCCYLSCREQNTTFSGSAYYTSASSALKDIISELAGGNTSEGFSSRTSKTSEKLYMMLSTAYFLSQCDIMLCNYRPLYDRLDSIKELFEDHWSEISGCLNTLDRRLLTWLAYLDLRSSLFGNQKYRRLGRSKRQKDLISVLIDLDGLSSLRVVSGGQSYLSACYGDNYPATELQDDLRQEPCHTKCDDVLSIFSSLNCFETWDEEHPMGSGDPMLEELRSTKVQTLRANLSRIRAECTILFSPSSSRAKDTVDRTAFHALTVIALHLSATILLNRILNPSIRTDLESQEAAHEIIRIAHRLRKAKYLDTPRSLLWPLPLFVAGIETTDEIYQDWILSYLTEMYHWGGYVKKSRDLLEEICKRQERQGQRVKVKDAMNDLNMTIIV